MNNISFKSQIKLISQQEFDNKTKNLNPKKHEVDYPWTPETGKTGKNLFTTGVHDCVVVGVVDGKKAKLYHLCQRSRRTGIDTHQKGFDIRDTERRILDGVNLDNPDLHAFIFGGWHRDNPKYNKKHVEKIEKIFDKNLIPYSVIAGNRPQFDGIAPASVFYSNKEDTFYITNGLLTEDFINKDTTVDEKENYLRNKYNKVDICQFDTIA